MEKETYYGIECRRGNTWHPITSYAKYKALKTYSMANKELMRIADLEKNQADPKTVEEFRLIRYELQLSSEIVKNVIVND